MNSEGRYSRQERFVRIGPAGQEKFGCSTVVILGCGALGSGIAQCLGRAGIGRLRIVDRDFLEMSNLARQLLFEEDDVRLHKPKAIAAAERLSRINSEICIEPVVTDINSSNVMSLIRGADVVADGSDNMELRFLVNDACVSAGIPWVYGGAVGSNGMQMTVRPGNGPCLRCVLEDIPAPDALQTCNEAGVLNTLTSTVSAIQANEVLKLVLGETADVFRLLRINIWQPRMEESLVARRPDCPACGLRRFDFLKALPSRTERLRGKSLVQVNPLAPITLDFAALAPQLRSLGDVEYNEFLMILRLPDCELNVFPDGRVIVKGIPDEESALRAVERYLAF